MQRWRGVLSVSGAPWTKNIFFPVEVCTFVFSLGVLPVWHFRITPPKKDVLRSHTCQKPSSDENAIFDRVVGGYVGRRVGNRVGLPNARSIYACPRRVCKHRRRVSRRPGGAHDGRVGGTCHRQHQGNESPCNPNARGFACRSAAAASVYELRPSVLWYPLAIDLAYVLTPHKGATTPQGVRRVRGCAAVCMVCSSANGQAVAVAALRCRIVACG